MSKSLEQQKAIFTELVKVGLQWHAAHKAVQAEDDPDKKEKLIYNWETIERHLGKLLEERQKMSAHKLSVSKQYFKENRGRREQIN